jgi:hypothetical protein
VLVLAPSGGSATRWTGLPYGVEAGILGTVTPKTGFALLVAWMRFHPGAAVRERADGSR